MATQQPFRRVFSMAFAKHGMGLGAMPRDPAAEKSSQKLILGFSSFVGAATFSYAVYFHSQVPNVKLTQTQKQDTIRRYINQERVFSFDAPFAREM